MTKIPVSELPQATRPGEAGIRRLADGSLSIPLGMNLVKHLSPQLAERRYWEHARAAGGRDASAGRYPALTCCSSCTARIGRGYIEREIYLIATTFDTRRVAGRMISSPHWRFICSTCATVFLPEHTENKPLNFGFMLLCEADWGEPACHNLYHLDLTVVRAKINDLNRQLIPAWNTHLRAIKTALIKRGRTSIAELEQIRQPVFERFVYAFAPEPLTYSELVLPRVA